MFKKLTRITYAEDEADVRAVAVLSMEKLGGYNVDICKDGFEALKRAPLFKPDLILLDVMMPNMDGEETLQRLRSIPELDDVPIAFMTAKSECGDIEHYFKLGANGVIPKPFNPILLPHRIGHIWRSYHDH